MAEHFNEANFSEKVLKSDKPAMIDFFAQWCGPCKMMAPIIDELAEAKKDSWLIGKVDVDEAGDLAAKYGIQSIPTIIIFKDGAEVDRIIGFQSKEALNAKLV